jgi:O-antigen/teichoic acid export membrane protein
MGNNEKRQSGNNPPDEITESASVFEKIFQLGKDTIIYGLTNISYGLVGLFLLPIYTRVFSPLEYGIIEVGITLSAVISIICGLQIESGVARYYYEKTFENRITLVSTGFFSRMLFVLPLLLILLPFNNMISLILLGSTEYGPIISVALITIPFSNLYSYLLLILRLHRSARAYAIISLGNFLSMAIFNIYLITILKIGIIGVFIGPLISYILFTVLAIIITKKYIKICFSPVYLREILLYSIPVIPVVIASFSRSNIDRFLMIPFIGLVGVGIFSIGVKISSILLLLSASFSLAWVPFSMSIINHKNNKEVYSHILTLFTFISSCVALMLMAFSQELLYFMVPDTYWDALNVIPFLLLSVIFTGMFSIVGIGLNIVKKTYLNTYSYLFGLFFGVIIIMALCPLIGILGAAIAASVSSFASLLLEYYFSQKEYFIRYDIKKISAILSVYLLAVPIVILINSFDSSYYNVVSKVCITVILMFLMARVLGKRDICTGIKQIMNRCSLSAINRYAKL